jgi:hypothetical protein
MKIQQLLAKTIALIDTMPSNVSVASDVSSDNILSTETHILAIEISLTVKALRRLLKKASEQTASAETVEPFQDLLAKRWKLIEDIHNCITPINILNL